MRIPSRNSTVNTFRAAARTAGQAVGGAAFSVGVGVVMDNLMPGSGFASSESLKVIAGAAAIGTPIVCAMIKKHEAETAKKEAAFQAWNAEREDKKRPPENYGYSGWRGPGG